MWIAVAILVTLIVLVLLFCYLMAFYLVYPHDHSIENGKQLMDERGFWRDFDAMEKKAYIVTAADGYQLHAQVIFAKEPSNQYVILSHGYSCNWCFCVKYVHIFRQLGFHCIVYDNRGHGLNAPSICTVGLREAADLIDVIADTRCRFGDGISIGLHGESMGAALTAIALSQKPDVEFAVLDCGYARLMDVVQHRMKRLFGIPKVLCYPASLMCRLFFGFAPWQAKPAKALEDNVIPVCLIHGQDDDFVTCDHSEALYRSNKGYVELHIFPGAEHTRSIDTDEAAYQAILEQFLAKCRQGALSNLDKLEIR